MSFWQHTFVVSIATVSLALAGCSHSQREHAAKASPVAAAPVATTSAIAVLHPTAGHTVTGVVRFTQTGTGVRVVADVAGLAPGMAHGFHIHEFGDCSSPDATSAGGHFNPAGHPHGGPTAAMRHAGDLGNLTADANGRAHLDILMGGLRINGTADAILGRAVIVHDKPDDLVSQPVGNAGPRAACGVIGIAKN